MQSPAARTFDVTSASGRTLAVCRWGTQGGVAIVGCHGSPGSRLDAVPDEATLRSLRLDYVTYDRPGYGRSSRAAGRTVADAAADVAAILDRLDLDRVAVIGGSGGAPHALACAALLPERVLAAAAVVPPAPYHLMADDAAFFDGMEPTNAEQFRAALNGGAAALEPLLHADEVQRQADARGNEPDPQTEEAMRQGIGGLLDDVLAVHSPWGFDPAMITAPVDVWFGTDDVHAPQARWLASRIPRSRVHEQHGDHSWPATRRDEIFASLHALAERGLPRDHADDVRPRRIRLRRTARRSERVPAQTSAASGAGERRANGRSKAARSWRPR